MLPSDSFLSLSPPPPPPPPPPLEALVAKTLEAPPQKQHSTSSDGLNPSLLIISAIIIFVAVASASIHLLLRFLSRQSQQPTPLILRRFSSSSSASTSSSIAGNQKALIDSLPLFSLASSLAKLPKSSPDCAVCLSRFEPDDQLRLLPSCRHAFHSTCIDTWLRSSRSCPLCRDPISLNPPPPQSAPVPAMASDRSGSFRLEIGSVSRRRTTEEVEAMPAPNLPPHARSYSLGSSFDYVVEEEVEAVVAAVAAHVRRGSEMAKDDKGVMAPGEEVAEAAGGGGKGWLKDYVDRLASSASSSFSSLRYSGRFSRRSDAGCGGSWDLEGNPNRMEEDGVYSFYRWLTGV